MQHICGDEFNVLQRVAWINVLDAFPELKVEFSLLKVLFQNLDYYFLLF